MSVRVAVRLGSPRSRSRGPAWQAQGRADPFLDAPWTFQSCPRGRYEVLSDLEALYAQAQQAYQPLRSKTFCLAVEAGGGSSSSFYNL